MSDSMNDNPTTDHVVSIPAISTAIDACNDEAPLTGSPVKRFKASHTITDHLPPQQTPLVMDMENAPTDLTSTTTPPSDSDLVTLPPPIKNPCAVCGTVSKYTCPGCSLKTCSVPCVKEHKVRFDCTGTAKPTVYLPKSQLNENTLLDDLKLIANVEHTLKDTHHLTKSHALPTSNETPSASASTNPKKDKFGKHAKNEPTKTEEELQMDKFLNFCQNKLKIAIYPSISGHSTYRLNKSYVAYLSLPPVKNIKANHHSQQTRGPNTALQSTSITAASNPLPTPSYPQITLPKYSNQQIPLPFRSFAMFSISLLLPHCTLPLHSSTAPITQSTTLVANQSNSTLEILNTIKNVAKTTTTFHLETPFPSFVPLYFLLYSLFSPLSFHFKTHDEILRENALAAARDDPNSTTLTSDQPLSSPTTPAHPEHIFCSKCTQFSTINALPAPPKPHYHQQSQNAPNDDANPYLDTTSFNSKNGKYDKGGFGKKGKYDKFDKHGDKSGKNGKHYKNRSHAHNPDPSLDNIPRSNDTYDIFTTHQEGFTHQSLGITQVPTLPDLSTSTAPAPSDTLPNHSTQPTESLPIPSTGPTPPPQPPTDSTSPTAPASTLTIPSPQSPPLPQPSYIFLHHSHIPLAITNDSTLRNQNIPIFSHFQAFEGPLPTNHAEMLSVQDMTAQSTAQTPASYPIRPHCLCNHSQSPPSTTINTAMDDSHADASSVPNPATMSDTAPATTSAQQSTFAPFFDRSHSTQPLFLLCRLVSPANNPKYMDCPLSLSLAVCLSHQSNEFQFLSTKTASTSATTLSSPVIFDLPQLLLVTRAQRDLLDSNGHISLVAGMKTLLDLPPPSSFLPADSQAQAPEQSTSSTTTSADSDPTKAFVSEPSLPMQPRSISPSNPFSFAKNQENVEDVLLDNDLRLQALRHRYFDTNRPTADYIPSGELADINKQLQQLDQSGSDNDESSGSDGSDDDSDDSNDENDNGSGDEGTDAGLWDDGFLALINKYRTNGD